MFRGSSKALNQLYVIKRVQYIKLGSWRSGSYFPVSETVGTEEVVGWETAEVMLLLPGSTG